MKKITLLFFVLFVGATAFAQTTVTHNASQAIEAGEGLTCSSGIVTDNNFYGVFDLSTDFAISYDFVIQEFEFGLETLANAPGDIYPVMINFYTTDNGAPTGVLTQLGATTSTVVSSADAGTVVNVDVNAAGAIVPTGEVLVCEVVIFADGVTDFRFGANLGGATDDSWLMAPDCGATAPVTYASLGFPQHHIMNVTGGDTSGVNEELSQFVSVYPNPANNVLNISVDSSLEVKSSTLFDVLGKNTGIQSMNGTMDVSDLTKGVYILSIETTSGSISQKVVKQ